MWCRDGTGLHGGCTVYNVHVLELWSPGGWVGGRGVARWMAEGRRGRMHLEETSLGQVSNTRSTSWGATLG